MPRILDLEHWPRRAAFDFFREYDNPYFNVCAPVEVTALRELSRSAGGFSFSSACLWIALRVANSYEPFRYRLQSGEVIVHDRIHAATTVLVGDEQLAFIYFDHDEDFGAFCENAARAKQVATHGGRTIDDRADRTDLIHFSSLPWVSFTSISHARNWRREDSIPKITFGRYQQVGNQVHMPVSVEVHHALMDGLHVGRFFERLQRDFADAETTLCTLT